MVATIQEGGRRHLEFRNGCIALLFDHQRQI